MKLEGSVLIVEDDPNTAALVATYLEREGFTTIISGDGQSALDLARRNPPGFVIHDVMLPGADGWEVCRELRKFSDVPVLMLTAREEEIDRVLGLSLGADDYVVKPFSPRELIERVKAILRRSQRGSTQNNNTITIKELHLDGEKHRVTLAGKPVTLTSLEYKILQALMRSPGRVFSRDELLGHCYPDGETVIDRVIDVHVGKLRQKIEHDPAEPVYILTARGFGYSFTEEASG